MARKGTRNAQGAGSIRKRPDGNWEGRYTIGRDPGTGKQVQKSLYGQTQKEVRQKLQQIAADIDEGVYTEPSRLTLGIWLDIWLNEYCNHLKESTLALYRLHVDRIIKPALGSVKLTALTAPAVQKFCNGLKIANGSVKPQSPKSIKNIHGVLHRALQQAVELGYIRLNPANACKLPRIEKPPIKPLDEADISRLLDAIKGDAYERELVTALFTGMRQAELLGLTWDCIDFQHGTIHLRHQLQLINGEYRLTTLRTINPAPSLQRKGYFIDDAAHVRDDAVHLERATENL